MNLAEQAHFGARDRSKAPWRSAVQALATTDPLSRAPTLLILDSLDVIGGHYVFLQAAADLCATLSLRSRGVVAVAMERPAAELAAALAAAPRLAVLDARSAAHGSLQLPGGVPPAPHVLPATLAAPPSAWLPALHAALAVEGPAALILDGLSPWVAAHGLRAVLAALEELAASSHTACILAALHADLHDPCDAALLQRAAHSVVSLAPGDGREGVLCAARCATLCPRAGPRVEAAWVSRVEGGGGGEPKRMEFEAASGKLAGPARPQAVVHDQGGAAPAARAVRPGVEAGGSLPPGPGLAGGMKLGLTAEESVARSAVQLPYEHQGQGSQYDVADYREYLPAAAGGLHCATNHIFYVRDSDSEHDSDEDPDDEIDI